MQIHRERGLLGAEGGDNAGVVTASGYRFYFGIKTTFWNYMLVIVAQRCEGTVTHSKFYVYLSQLENYAKE